jgi:hypothetical protein
MSDHPTATRAQKLFLRAFRDNPAGPPPSDWPAPAVLRRWLEDETFRQTLTSLRDTLRFQTDFYIATAAASASRTLQTTIAPLATRPPAEADAPAQTNPTPVDLDRQLRSLTSLLRLAHLRHRFTTAPTDDRPDPSPKTDGKKTFTPVAWNPNWTDRPDHIANIFCDPDKSRLKAYLVLQVIRGRKDFAPFLTAYPEELANALEHAEKRDTGPHPAQSTSSTTPVTRQSHT